MKSIINLLILIAACTALLIAGGFIDPYKLLDLVAGEVVMGETKQIFDESELKKRLELIVGEVEVHDTSSTAFERSSRLCQPAYVVTATHATVKYAVKTTPELFMVDSERKVYYISPKLGVTFIETDKTANTNVLESNCVRKQHISTDAVEQCQQIAFKNFRNAIEKSDKIIEAQAAFIKIKQQIIETLEKEGFKEEIPANQLLD